jgi:hypothetical protein
MLPALELYWPDKLYVIMWGTYSATKGFYIVHFVEKVTHIFSSYTNNH